MLDDYSNHARASDASEELFRRVFHTHSAIMLLIDPVSGIIIDANPAASAFYGYAEDVLRGMQISSINTQPEQDIFAEMRDAVEERRNYFVFSHRRADGEVRQVEVHSSAVAFRGRKLLFSIVFDITERKYAEDLQRIASLVYQHASEAMVVVDGAGMIINVNPAFTVITGYTAEEVRGRSIRLLNSDRENLESYLRLSEGLQKDGRWQGELWARRKNGEHFLRRLSVNSIYNEDGSVQCRVSLFSDITRTREADELIWRQANFDLLTGLPNRSMFQDRLTQVLKQAHRLGRQVALLCLDLDYFKEVNDTLGHAMGDLLLQETARRLTRCVRESDTVARLGGDEFTVILADIDENYSVERVTQDILQCLAQPYVLGEETFYPSASIGVTFFPEDGQEADTLLKHADQAMYAAKAQGRGRCSYFTAAMQQAAQNRKRLVSGLRTALAENHFRVYYQPIVDLSSGAIHKAEALIRWHHPEQGLISPSEFIPTAEETGIIDDIGKWVFHEAARQVARWRARYHPAFQVGVNVSPSQFRKEGGIGRAAWLDYLHALQLPGQSVAVEITEGLLMDASPAVTEQLLAFRDHGVQVALDDFGTGYSSLAYLKKFDIDYIKIDRAFVQNLSPGSDDLALCEAMIVMAHKLGIKVVAEGVETEEQRALLALCGCDYAQGYLFSKPLPAEEFERLL